MSPEKSLPIDGISRERTGKVADSMVTKKSSQPKLEPASCSTSMSSSNSSGGESLTAIKGDDLKNKHATSKPTKQEGSVSRPSANGQSQTVASSSKTPQTGRRAQQKSNHSGQDGNKSAKDAAIAAANKGRATYSTLEQFSAKAHEIKQDIFDALEKQSKIQVPDEPIEIVQLKTDILKLSLDDKNSAENGEQNVVKDKPSADKAQIVEESGPAEGDAVINTKESNDSPLDSKDSNTVSSPECDQKKNITTSSANDDRKTSHDSTIISAKKPLQQPKPTEAAKLHNSSQEKRCSAKQTDIAETELGNFEPLSAKLDQETKYITLVSSLKKDFEGSPGMLEPICKKLVQMSELISKLQSDCENYDLENKKLLVIKQRLENLCRELQKSNNTIRIESLDLIKMEQGKAKEQTTKIQSTLSGVIKLFDENQQRNMTLRQENQELQTKLRSLLEHCDNWEKGFATALRQRDIENRLLKTELAKANLLKNEEKEKFLKEKQDLLQLLSMMQEHQTRIEGQEAKLRCDLSNYASKYDECQAVISEGMSKFQTESKRMLKQIEKSKQDYKMLLTKYESSNKRMAQLLDEKQRWDRSMNVANKKIETLEKLCRALREQKATDLKGTNSSKSTGSVNEKIINNNKKNSGRSSNESAQTEKKKNLVAGVDTSCMVADGSSRSHVEDGRGDSGAISMRPMDLPNQTNAKDHDNDQLRLDSGDDRIAPTEDYHK